MARKVSSKDSRHSDIEMGVYKGGFFIPYDSDKQIRAELDNNSDPQALGEASRGKYIHGSLKDGNFRPAEISNREGFIHNYKTPLGPLGFNYEGDLLDEQGDVVGGVDVDGTILEKNEYEFSKFAKGHNALQNLNPKNSLPKIYWAGHLSKKHDPRAPEVYEEAIRAIREEVEAVRAGGLGVEDRTDKIPNLYRQAIKDSSREGRKEDVERLEGTLESFLRENNFSERRLISKISPVLAIVGAFILAIFFLSTNITGNAVGNLSKNSSSYIGGILFILCLFGIFHYSKTRKLKQKLE